MTTQDKIDILKELIESYEVYNKNTGKITIIQAKQWLAELESENNQMKVSNSGQVYYND